MFQPFGSMRLPTLEDGMTLGISPEKSGGSEEFDKVENIKLFSQSFSRFCVHAVLLDCI